MIMLMMMMMVMMMVMGDASYDDGDQNIEHTPSSCSGPGTGGCDYDGDDDDNVVIQMLVFIVMMMIMRMNILRKTIMMMIDKYDD